jgi:hypothetical protein
MGWLLIKGCIVRGLEVRVCYNVDNNEMKFKVSSGARKKGIYSEIN